MKTSDFLFDLPESQIAQTPIEPRDHSRMMCINRATGAISHEHFYNVIDHLQPNDALVINETRVIPARLYGERESGGACEVLLLRQIGPKRWETLVKPGKKIASRRANFLWRRPHDRDHRRADRRGWAHSGLCL